MWERLKEKRNEGGFTLIELLIVIIILAILAAIVVFAVGTTGKNSAVAACNADAKSVETAVEAYKAQMGSFPASLGALTASTATDKNGVTVGPWLRSVPNTVGTTGHYAIAIDTAGGVSVGIGGTYSNYDTANQCSSAS